MSCLVCGGLYTHTHTHVYHSHTDLNVVFGIVLQMEHSTLSQHPGQFSYATKVTLENFLEKKIFKYYRKITSHKQA